MRLGIRSLDFLVQACLPSYLIRGAPCEAFAAGAAHACSIVAHGLVKVGGLEMHAAAL
jgi:hypothetical protein